MTHFADCARSIRTTIIENEWIAKDTRRIRFLAPEMAASVVPGQFFMIRNPAGNDPLIGRALALYNRSPAPQPISSQSPAPPVDHDRSPPAAAGWIDLVYLVKGKLTSSLAKLRPGSDIAVWGPLGNGFPAAPVDHLVMVAGGIGQTPFLTLAQEALGNAKFGDAGNRPMGYTPQVSLCYGARSQEYLAGLEDFERAGVELHIATEDGSRGIHGRVTLPLEQLLQNEQRSGKSVRVVCCGPEPMMEAVAELAARYAVPCQVSLETPMACGIGICFTCVAKVGTTADWDYKRTCVEGPVFDAAEILWH
ncbi:dihydroorotate dehydrogenase electron transfer subunit [Aureliella helgolandensis]|uniref:Dihydroorotate dehydrogenase B (NAD(+)), electron transfer subunit n=1 Tax=Aureliella helgolandensis TaxID=2527968 RepID=A0A518GG96_9BACT|nr:dihydroorotate dehydrogenase electron transfer subunit [Aureliella helgolandensis]QDV27621.1 Dihydroorotate dehydrogenase B (NAD(+)), electron transfer subunit [Aureliella helgolandensis]